MTHPKLKATAVALATSACMMIPLGVNAADPAKAPSAQPAPAGQMRATDRNVYSDRAHMKEWSNEKEKLERELGVGKDKAFYQKALQDRGYTITSINSDKPNATEWEVVKGGQSYEVQLDYDNAGKATKLDVTTNMWRTPATKDAQRGKTVPMATQYTKGNEAYSDRARMQGWTGEKDKLEKSLTLGNDKGWYATQLKKMGYQITATNDREKDYVEYEVVKGTDTYEVQIDFDGSKAKKVDVTTNVWQADATDKAMSKR